MPEQDDEGHLEDMIIGDSPEQEKTKREIALDRLVSRRGTNIEEKLTAVYHELTRQYREDKEHGINTANTSLMIELAADLLASGLLGVQNDQHTEARAKQALYVLYLLRNEESDAVQNQIAYHRATALQIRFPDDDKLLEHAKEVSKNGKHDWALQNFDVLIVRNPRHKWVYYDKGHTLRELGRHDEALGCFKKAVEVNPDRETHYTLAYALSERGHIEEAKVQVGLALEKDPEYGHALSLQKELEGKAADYTTQDLGIDITDLLHCRRDVFGNFQRYNVHNLTITLVGHITEIINRGIKADSDEFVEEVSSKIYNEYDLKPGVDEAEVKKSTGNIALRIQDAVLCNGLYTEAAYGRVIERDPNDDSAYLGLGKHYLRQGRVEDAKSSFDIAAKLGNKEAEQLAAEIGAK